MMRLRPQALDLKRRAPRQDRALDTVDTIFEAAARILQSEGKDAFNTNHIAERAGISIGTLYQYFPNKNAILVALGASPKESATPFFKRSLPPMLAASRSALLSDHSSMVSLAATGRDGFYSKSCWRKAVGPNLRSR
jgi:hypothetical protein